MTTSAPARHARGLGLSMSPHWWDRPGLRSPYVAFARQPITCVAIAALGGWMIWFGVTLLTMRLLSPPVGYEGPRVIMGLRSWGAAFLVVGALMLVRLWLAERHALSSALHFLGVMVTVAWAASWYAGPNTTAIPAYTFVAVVCVFLPFIHPLAERWLKLTPRARA
jgi:hypothetical protein